MITSLGYLDEKKKSIFTRHIINKSLKNDFYDLRNDGKILVAGVQREPNSQEYLYKPETEEDIDIILSNYSSDIAWYSAKKI